MALTAAVVRYSVIAYLASVAPDVALRLDGAQPTALRSVAERLVADIERMDGERRAQMVAPSSGGNTDAPPRLSQFAAPVDLLPPNAQRARPSATPQGADPPASDERSINLRRARDLIERAIAAEPLDYQSLTLRGRIEELLAGSSTVPEIAYRFYEAAALISPRASDAIYRLMLRDFAKAKYVEAAKHADILLRTLTSAGPAVHPVLARMAEIPEATDVVVGLLAAGPPWRSGFFSGLNAHITDARTPLTLLLRLRQAEHKVATGDLKPYLNFLVGKGFNELAYYTWLQFLPPERLASTGLLYNGGFDATPSGFPFDWTISAGAGTTAGILPIPGEAGQQGLRVDFTSGRVQFGGVAQILLLSPGNYRLTGRYRGALDGKRGLRWRVICRSGKSLGETEMQTGLVPSWRELDLDFAVPASGCDAQEVRLLLDARSSSEQLVRGSIWYDDLAINVAR
ncbi:MAG: hypothetical protein AB7O57_08285 [Hyphomicrobiaceae bacterium]